MRKDREKKLKLSNTEDSKKAGKLGIRASQYQLNQVRGFVQISQDFLRCMVYGILLLRHDRN